MSCIKNADNLSTVDYIVQVSNCQTTFFFKYAYTLALNDIKPILLLIFITFTTLLIFTEILKGERNLMLKVGSYIVLAALYYNIWSNQNFFINNIYEPIVTFPIEFQNSTIKTIFNYRTVEALKNAAVSDLNDFVDLENVSILMWVILKKMTKTFAGLGWTEILSTKTILLIISILFALILVIIQIIITIFYVAFINIFFTILVFIFPIAPFLLIRKTTGRLFKMIITFSLYPIIMTILIGFNLVPLLSFSGEIPGLKLSDGDNTTIMITGIITMAVTVIALFQIPRISGAITEGAVIGTTEGARGIYNWGSNISKALNKLNLKKSGDKNSNKETSNSKGTTQQKNKEKPKLIGTQKKNNKQGQQKLLTYNRKLLPAPKLKQLPPPMKLLPAPSN